MTETPEQKARHEIFAFPLGTFRCNNNLTHALGKVGEKIGHMFRATELMLPAFGGSPERPSNNPRSVTIHALHHHLRDVYRNSNEHPLDERAIIAEQDRLWCRLSFAALECTTKRKTVQRKSEVSAPEFDGPGPARLLLLSAVSLNGGYQSWDGVTADYPPYRFAYEFADETPRELYFYMQQIKTIKRAFPAICHAARKIERFLELSGWEEWLPITIQELSRLQRNMEAAAKAVCAADERLVWSVERVPNSPAAPVLPKAFSFPPDARHHRPIREREPVFDRAAL